MKIKSHYIICVIGLLCMNYPIFATALDDYIAQPNPNYDWSEIDSVFDGSIWTTNTTAMRVLPDMRPYEADWTHDQQTDLKDFAVLGAYWLSDTPYYDLMPRRTGDGIIDLAELSVFSLHWLGDQ